MKSIMCRTGFECLYLAEYEQLTHLELLLTEQRESGRRRGGREGVMEGGCIGVYIGSTGRLGLCKRRDCKADSSEGSKS